MQEPTEAQPALAGARKESMQGRGDRQARPDLVVGSVKLRDRTSGAWQDAHAQHDPSGSHLPRTMDQESLSHGGGDSLNVPGKPLF